MNDKALGIKSLGINIGASAIALLGGLAFMPSAHAVDYAPSRLPSRSSDLPQPSPAPSNPLTDAERADLLFKQALEQAAKDDLEGAIDAFSQAIRLKPGYVMAYYNRGTTYANMGNPRAAIADYTQVIQLKPNNPRVRYNRGLLRRSLGDRKGAIEDFQQAATLFRRQKMVKMQQQSLEQIKQLQQS